MQLDERARKNESVVLGAIARTGLEPISRAIGRDVSTVSRMKDADLKRFATMLAVCGLKVVPQEFRCAKPEVIEAALVFARAALNQNEHSLVWDD